MTDTPTPERETIMTLDEAREVLRAIHNLLYPGPMHIPGGGPESIPIKAHDLRVALAGLQRLLALLDHLAAQVEAGEVVVRAAKAHADEISTSHWDSTETADFKAELRGAWFKSMTPALARWEGLSK